MAMDAATIERLIKESLPDAQVSIEDLRGDGDHYAAHVVSGCSSTSWCIRRWAVGWAANCTPLRCKPALRRIERGDRRQPNRSHSRSPC
jgi:hypothetical protein